jgi:hypothetical protein
MIPPLYYLQCCYRSVIWYFADGTMSGYLEAGSIVDFIFFDCDAEDLRAPIQLHYLLRITVPEHQPNSKLGPPSIALGETRLHRRETLTTCRVHGQTIDIRSL